MSPTTGTRPTGEAAYGDASDIFRPREVRIVEGSKLDRDLDVEVDCVVIGTGAGGAPVAKELAEGGMRVAMLEEGRRFVTDEYNARAGEMTSRLYRDAGQTATVGVPPVLLPLGKGVGGSSHVNSATCFRTPPVVLDMWRHRFGLESMTLEELDPAFRRVERELNVSQVPAELAGGNTRVVKRGADRLGLHGDYIYRNVRGCVGSGVCNFGCPTSAKQHTGVTYVPRAWDAGATTYASCRVERILVEAGRVRAVEARSRSGRRVTVRAPVVVLAAGTVHSPLLLMASRLARGSGQLGRNLTLHPCGGMRARFEEEVDMGFGVPQAYYIDALANEGIMLEGAAGPPDYLAMAMPGVGAEHRHLMAGYRHLSQFGFLISDRPRGSVRRGRGGAPLVRYDLDRADVAKFERAFQVLADIYWAAGATEVYTPVPGAAVLRGGDVAPLHSRRLRAAELDVIAFHPLGTCRMGAGPADSVVGPDLGVWGTEGLYVADGSVVPSSLGVNPQETIMALATRLAFRLLDRPIPEEPAPERIAEPHVSVAHL